MQGVSKAEFARHRGVSKAMVTKYSDAGLLRYHDDGSIDVAATDAVLAMTLDASRGGKGGWSERATPTPIENDEEDDGGRIDPVLADAMLDEQVGYLDREYASTEPLAALLDRASLRLIKRQRQAIEVAQATLERAAGPAADRVAFRRSLGRLFGRIRVAIDVERDELETELRALFEASRNTTTRQ